jgi:hypothetical protein
MENSKLNTSPNRSKPDELSWGVQSGGLPPPNGDHTITCPACHTRFDARDLAAVLAHEERRN